MLQGKLVLLALMAFICLTASSATGQQTWTTVKEVDSGPDNNRINIVIMGDGYTSAEMPIFRAHVTQFISLFLATEPMATYRGTINIHRVEVESTQSGSDKPSSCYSPQILVDTELDSKYCTGGTQRCITCDTNKALGTAFINVPAYDEVLVLVNDPEYGGCAGTVACSTGVHPSGSKVAIHELGHSIFGLADEYWTNGTTYTGSEPGQVNVSTYDSPQMAANQTKWHHWLGLEGVSTYQGGYYNQLGIYRPRANCYMKDLGQPFCPVCRERAVESLWGHVTSADSMTPPVGALIAYGTDLSVSVVAPQPSSTLTFSWFVDSFLRGSGTATTANGVTTSTFNAGPWLTGATGNHLVLVRVYDSTSYYQKSVPLQAVPPKVWVLTDNFPDLSVTSLSQLTTASVSGEIFDVQTTVANPSQLVTPVVRMGFYASQDSTVDTSDILIGERMLPALIAGASTTDITHVRLPVATQPANWTIGVIVDDLETVAEIDETNNIQVLPGILTAPANTRLVASQGIMHFATAAQIDFAIDGGGPASAGHGYHLIPSATFTNNYTQLGLLAGALPMVFDGLSAASMAGTIGFPYFQDFSGVLDANGQATAHFWTPALGMSFPPSIYRFVAVTTAVNSTTGQMDIVLVTNAVNILSY